MKILLIAGHGAGDPGACANGYKEADLTREVVAMLQPLLSQYADVTVYDTDKSMCADLRVDLKYDFSRFDYVLEVHFNAGVADSTGNGKTTGTEIYIHKNKLTDRVESQILNRITNFGFKSRGVKRVNNLLVLNKCHSYGTAYALLEVCFIDDSDDIKLYQSKKKEITAEIATGIISGYNLKQKGKLTMGQYEELKKMIVDNTEKVYHNYSEVPDWGKSTVKKLIESGCLNGENAKDLNIPYSTLRIFVVLDRAGLLKINK